MSRPPLYLEHGEKYDIVTTPGVAVAGCAWDEISMTFVHGVGPFRFTVHEVKAVGPSTGGMMRSIYRCFLDRHRKRRAPNHGVVGHVRNLLSDTPQTASELATILQREGLTRRDLDVQQVAVVLCKLAFSGRATRVAPGQYVRRTPIATENR